MFCLLTVKQYNTYSTYCQLPFGYYTYSVYKEKKYRIITGLLKKKETGYFKISSFVVVYQKLKDMRRFQMMSMK